VLTSEDAGKLVVLIGTPLMLRIFLSMLFCFFVFLLTFCAGF